MNTAIGDYPQEANWFAAQTRSRHEKVAATMLESLGVPHYLPLRAETHRWSDRKKTVATPLFKGYLFVKLNPTKGSRLRVLTTPGITGLVGNQTGPLPIPDTDIEKIRTVLAQEVECDPFPFYSIGERVRVKRGALTGVEGTLVRTEADCKLVLSVEMIQQSIAINIHASDVEPAERSANIGLR